MRDDQGELTGMILGSHLDITGTQEITDSFTITQKEFEKTKRQVIKDNAFLKAVLNSPKELFIVAIDKHFRFLGFSDEYISFARKNYERALNGESFVTNNSIVLADGKKHYYENKYSPIIDQHGKILGLTLNKITSSRSGRLCSSEV